MDASRRPRRGRHRYSRRRHGLRELAPLLPGAGAGVVAGSARPAGGRARSPDRGRRDARGLVDPRRREARGPVLSRERRQRGRPPRPRPDPERTLRPRRLSRRLPRLRPLDGLPVGRRPRPRRPRGPRRGAGARLRTATGSCSSANRSGRPSPRGSRPRPRSAPSSSKPRSSRSRKWPGALSLRSDLPHPQPFRQREPSRERSPRPSSFSWPNATRSCRPSRAGVSIALSPAPKTLFVIPGAGHNDTYIAGGEAYWKAVGDFLAESGGGISGR